MVPCRALITTLSVFVVAVGADCGFPDCIPAHPDLDLPPHEGYMDMVCAQRPAPAGAVRVACVGDSITAGYGTASREETYPAQLQALLDKTHGEGVFSVTNLGLCSSTMRKNASMPYWKYPHFKALVEAKWDIVIIMLGTNDAKDSGDNPNNWQSSCERWRDSASGGCSFAEDYASMIDTARGLGVSTDRPKIYTAIPPPLMRNLEDLPTWGMNQTAINGVYSGLIKRITKEAGVLGPIDVFSGLGGVPDWKATFPDGGCIAGAETLPACRWFCDARICDQCHPTARGYKKIASLVASHLRQFAGLQRRNRGMRATSFRALSAQ